MLRFSISVLLLGAALAQASNGWKDGKEYKYNITSRTLASFNGYANQFSGIVMEGQLTVQLNERDTLRARISQARYSPIHTKLEKGWESEIPHDKMNMQNFAISDKPFEIKTKRGVVKDLIVDKNLPTWQVNVLKSIVGQLQVDTQGENVDKSKHNQFPEGKQPLATYKTMEDSVGGKCEVLYDISPLPELMVLNKPEWAPMPELREDGEIISIVKSKNYSNCVQRASFHFGVNGRNDWEPGSNENGQYLSRSSVSRIVISGDVKKYTIQSSTTSNKVVFNTDQPYDSQGSILSKIELRLHKVNDIQDNIPAPSNPESIGNLVYDYNSPFAKNSQRQSNHSKNHQTNKNNKEHWRDNDDSYEIETKLHVDEEEGDLQPEPTLTDPPSNPMLPFFIGNNGHSIKADNKIDIVKSVKSLAEEIGSEMVHYDIMPEEDTLEKFTILSQLVRLMNAEEIGKVAHELYEQPRPRNEHGPPSSEQKVRRNTWVVFRDAVAQAGTGPALVNVKKWIQEKKIKDAEAAKVIDSLAKSTRTPTTDYMDNFLEMLKMKEVIDPPVVFDNAHQSYADLLRHAVVNKKSAHNRYPVHTFGKFYGKNIHHLHSKYFPYMTSQLQEGFDRKDSIKIQVIVSAIGRTGHPRMLSVFEPYIEGKKQATPYQRLFMVLSMHRLATSYPKTARSVFYKIYSNTADHYEIRTAAVYLLMKTNPTASVLQRMADFTNYDNSKQVSSAVKSSIESLAQLQDNENHDLANAARAALPLLTKEIFGPQYSRAMFKTHKNPMTHSGYSLDASYIGSDDSIIPKGVSITISPVQSGMKMPKIHIAGAVSKIQDLIDSLDKQLGLTMKSNEKTGQKKYSPENIAKALGINADKAQLLEGFMAFTDASDTVFFSYSDSQTPHSGEQLDNLMVDLPEKLRRLLDDLSRGVNFDETSFLNTEVIMSFPTETGYPLTFNLRVPSISKLIGQAKVKLENQSENHLPVPTSATLNAKVHMIHGMKIEKRISFVTPFEHQQYVAGLDKSVQFHLPIKAEIQYNQNTEDGHVKIQPNNENPQFKIIQTKVVPFTSNHDILSLKPVSTDKSTRIIDKENCPFLDVYSKDKQKSLLFTWKRSENIFVTAEKSALKESIGAASLSDMVSIVASMYFTNPKESAEYQTFSVKCSPESDLSLEMKVSYGSLITYSNENDENSSDKENEKPKAKAPLLAQNMSQKERKVKLLREVSENINSAEAAALDLSLKINGELSTSATFTIAGAKSNVDDKSRTLLYTTVKVPNDPELFFSAGFESKIPDFKTMDFEETLKANSQHEFDSQMKFGVRNMENSVETFHVNGKLRQTDGRKTQIRQSKQAEECRKEGHRSGNKLTRVCQKANEYASMLNAGDFTVEFEDQSPMQLLSMGALEKAQAMIPIRMLRNPREKGEKNKFMFSFEVSPDDKMIDLSVTTPEGTISVPDIEMPKSYINNYENTDSGETTETLENSMGPFTTCSLDKTQVKTFDNHRYDTQLGQCWHVAMTPFPKNDYFRQGQQIEISDDKHLTVMIRDNVAGHKDLTITMGNKEIELTSSANRKVEAKIDGEKIRLMKKHSYQEHRNEQIVLEIFELADKSVKIVSEKFQFEIIYDGSRAIIKAGDKYRGSVRGLCGDNDGEVENDQKTPKGCLLEAAEEFSATYAFVNDKHCEGPARQNAEKANQSECVDESTHPGNVISNKEAGRKHHGSSSSSSKESDSSSSSSKESDSSSEESVSYSSEEQNCTNRRTMVSRSDSEICFSVKPVPTCASGCHSTGKKNKAVGFHCVRKSRTSERIAQRVEKGANPDLTQKKVSKTEHRMVPISCKA